MSPSGPVYVVSDIHLGVGSRERERAFVRWLAEFGPSASELIINGDLFDFWFEYRSVVPRGHTRVLGALAAIVDAGTPVRLMGGNHDWWGGSFLEHEIGLTLHRDPLVLELAGWRTFLGHGDGLGQGDLGYRILRRVLRGRLTRWGFRWLHPDLGARVAGRVSLTEEHLRSPSKNQKRRAELLESWAVDKLRAESDLDLVVLGHTHIPRLVPVDGNRYYINSGDWLTHYTYVELRPGAPPLLQEWKSG
jgi:UDP-2,3-diacylglucosamine hydrolase